MREAINNTYTIQNSGKNKDKEAEICPDWVSNQIIGTWDGNIQDI